MYTQVKYNHRMAEEKEMAYGLRQMVWGASWTSPPRKAVTIHGSSYIRTLEEDLLPYYQPGVRFQQDNGLIHTCNQATEWFECHGIWVAEWPLPYSQDPKPIKHMWHALKRIVYMFYANLNKLGRSKEDLACLCRRLKEAWRRIPNSLIHRILNTMPRRVAAVRDAKGYQKK
jgi:hypothetical protein